MGGVGSLADKWAEAVPDTKWQGKLCKALTDNGRERLGRSWPAEGKLPSFPHRLCNCGAGINKLEVFVKKNYSFVLDMYIVGDHQVKILLLFCKYCKFNTCVLMLR